jgi:hypothetical protein
VAYATFGEDAVAGDPIKCLSVGFLCVENQPLAQAAVPSVVSFSGIRYHLVKRAGHGEREKDGELAAAEDL